MANRPRLPNVDPEDLAKLASQYPGSRTSGAADSVAGGEADPSSSIPPRPAGTSSAATSSTSSSSAGSSPAAASSAASASSSRPGGPTAGGPTAPTPTPPPPTPRRRGGWFTAFLTFLFAIIAVLAAAVSVGGPSYRAEIRALLVQYKDDLRLNDDMINTITGYDTDRVELTYAALDARIQQLTEALERVQAADGVSGTDIRGLLFRDEVAAGLDSVAERLGELSDRVATIAGETATQADQIAGLQSSVTEATDRFTAELSAATKRVDSDLTATTERLDAEVTAAVQGLQGETAARLEALSAELETAITTLQTTITAVQDEVAATRDEVGGLGERMGTAEAMLDDQTVIDTAMTDRLVALDDRLANLIGDFTDLLDLNDQVAQTVATFKTENMPILAVIQLRDAVNRSEPYSPELSFANRVLNGAPGIGAALDKLGQSATDGIASVPELRRDLRLIANNLGTIFTKVESWSDRVTGWFNMLVGASTVPEARQGGNFVALVATIDDALERGDLELAVREGAAMQAEWRSTALADWLNAVIERMEVTDAVRRLEDVVYARATAPRAGQGADKAQ